MAEQQRRILLAEDDQISQKVIGLYLEKLGYSVEIVNNGLEVLEALEQGSYAAIFLDCRMPAMNGYATAAAIRSSEESSGCRVPIIAVTASIEPSEAMTCQAAGMDDYIAKPVTMGQLAGVLRRWLDGGQK